MDVKTQREQWEAVGTERTLKIDDLVLRDDMQMRRTGLKDQWVEEMSEKISSLPPVSVMMVYGERILTDGFHRVAAHKAAGKTDIKALVMPGHTEKEALRYATLSQATWSMDLTPPMQTKSTQCSQC